MAAAPELGVGVVGFGWMGQVHARAHLRLPQHFPNTPLRPRLVAVADTDAGRRDEAQSAYGFEQAFADWQELIATVLLVVAALATSWSSYQATRWNGEQAAASSRTNAIRIEAWGSASCMWTAAPRHGSSAGKPS